MWILNLLVEGFMWRLELFRCLYPCMYLVLDGTMFLCVYFSLRFKFLGYFCLTNSDVYACNVCVATQAKYTHM